MSNSRVVWIISEGSPGHVSQSVGLASALAERISLTVQRLECRPRLNGMGRSLVRAWMGRSRILPTWFLRRWIGLSAEPAERPDFILSSGGKSVFAGRCLALKYGVPYVFVGERKPYDSGWFHTVLTPSPYEHGANDLSIELIPTQITRGVCARAAAAWPDRPEGPLWAMIIGGSSVSHVYTPADWDRLAEGLNTLARRAGIRWLLTTSRRTDPEADVCLRARLQSDLVADAVWWSTKPEKKMAAYLGAAERVWVTQDSVTMVTEAVCSGRPVVVLRPECVVMKPRSFMSAYLERLEENGRIRRLRIVDLMTEDALQAGPSFSSNIPGSPVDAVAAMVQERLKF